MTIYVSRCRKIVMNNEVVKSTQTGSDIAEVNVNYANLRSIDVVLQRTVERLCVEY